jgi:arylsulfatase A
VIIFLADDMGWADWEQNGATSGSTYYETPNMNRLAREGVTFVNAYASAAVCSPTRNALLTGQSPARSHMTQWLNGSTDLSALLEPAWTRTLDPDDTTLAEAFQAAG